MMSFLSRTAAMVAMVLLFLVASPTILNRTSTERANETAAAAYQPLPATETSMVEIIVAKTDDRAEKLQKFLESYSSPMASDAAALIQIADKYDLDWTFLPAIAGLESQFGKHVPASSFNPYGWNNGRAGFKDWADASETVAAGIRSRYQSEGEVTADGIGSRYAESPTWALRVKNFQAKIVKF